MVGIIIALFVGGFLGMAVMALFAADSYNKGYADGMKDFDSN